MSSPMPVPAAPIVIEDQYYYEILTELGYPFVSEEDIEFTRSDIENYFILPAMREYFRWYPVTTEQSVPVSGRFSVPFEDLFTFGIVDARVNNDPSGSGATGNPLINELTYKHTGSGRYGTRNDYDLTVARIYERMEAQGFINHGRSIKIKVDRKNRRVTGYSNLTGDLIITWAKWDNEFNVIPYNHINEVIALSKAYTLRKVAMLRGQQASNTEIEFNYDMFMQRADELEEGIIEKWRNHTKVVVMRG